MTYCVIPGCHKPLNPDTHRVCQSCGSKLLLRERYRPLQPIGQGGFGKTFLAVDEDIPSKPKCVIKQLCLERPTTQSYAKAVQLFQQEAVRLDELGQHSQIPDLLAHFEQNRLLYLIQEFIEGQTLTEELQVGLFSEAQILGLLRDLLTTLQYIHDRNVIHRDIKPSNIIRRRSDRRFVLIDFGIAKVVSSITSPQTGTIVGTAEFMAPEQNRGKVFPASDLYSLAVVCIHLMTGLSPDELFDPVDACWIWRDRLPVGSRVSKPLGLILDRMLEPAVKNRYQSATEVIQAIGTMSSRSMSPSTRFKLLNSTAPANSPGSLASPTIQPSPTVDLQQLERWLTQGEWQAADEETWVLIKQALNKPVGSFVFSGDLSRIPCPILEEIDQLWVIHSKGRFGFSIQTKIYRAVGDDYGRFCDRVGWLSHNQHDSVAKWRFQTSAPAGHLPSRLSIGGQQWWRHMAVLAARIEQCAAESL